MKEALNVLAVCVMYWVLWSIFWFGVGLFGGFILGRVSEVDCNKYTVGQVLFPAKPGYCMSTVELISD